MNLLLRKRGLLAAAICFPQSALAIDLQPGEDRAPWPGMNLIMLSYQVSERGDFYARGKKVAGAPVINASQLQLRLGRSFEVAGQPAFFYAQTPVGFIHPAGSLNGASADSGAGDTSFMLAFWPYADRQTDTYVGGGIYVTVPTGRYDYKRSFNMGQNRYNTAFQLGVHAPVADRLFCMGAIDAVRFGDNDTFGSQRSRLAQKALYSSQASLGYEFSPTYTTGATYFYTSGGETSVNGASRNDRIRLRRYQLIGIANLAFGRITVLYGGDIRTENGFFEDRRWILRYTTMF